MQYQEKKGIYVYYLRENRDFFGNEEHLICHIYYETLEHFFWLYNDDVIHREIGHSIYDVKCGHVIKETYHRGYCGIRYRTISCDILCGKTNCTEHKSKGESFFVVCDENGKQYLPDVLVGLRRAWINDKKASKDYRKRYIRHGNGRKKKAYAGYRHMRTLQERKWAGAWDDEEFAPKTRKARGIRGIPDCWGGWLRHIDKSWKTQSKRKQQWKAP